MRCKTTATIAAAVERARLSARKSALPVRIALASCLLCCAAQSQQVSAEGVEVRICFDYACAHEAQAQFDAATLDSVARVLAVAQDAADERARMASAVGLLYLAAGKQTPIWRDRGGNRNDDTDVAGAMDCIDHSTNTTTFLRLMARLGMLRFHRVGEPLRRVRFFVAEHWSAHVIEVASGNKYVVDSWFFDPGTPAAVMPLQSWRDGAAPVSLQVNFR